MRLTRFKLASNLSKHLKVVCLVIASLFSSGAFSQWHFYEGTAFTTKFELFFWHPSLNTASQVHYEIVDEFSRIDLRFSRYQALSEISMINGMPEDENWQMTKELFNLVSRAHDISELTNGAFDITFASVGIHYDYRENKQPTEAQFKTAGTITYQDLILYPKNHEFRFTKPGVLIDLGGIAKGYAVDQAIQIFKKHGIESGRVSAGGDMRLLGDKQGQPWIVAVQDPRSADKQAVKLPLVNEAMSTSGDYERYFIDTNGERIHHILSPKTGKPAKGIQSVSVIGPDTTTTDALSTAMFVLGVEEGIALANKLEGIEVVIIDDKRKMHFSEGLTAP